MGPGNSSATFSSAEMEEIFRQTFGPHLERLGFVAGKKAQWVRETGVGIKHLFYLYPFRPGADYYPHGALSLDYVPRIQGSEVRLQSIAKHTRVHLVVSASGLGSGNRISRDRAIAQKTCSEIATSVVESVDSLLRAVESPTDVLKRLEDERASARAQFYCFPETALALAFTLAKTGHKAEAESELETVIQKCSLPKETHAAIRALLAATWA